MSPRKNSRRKIEYIKLPVAGDLASRLPLLLDMPGLLFVEARKRIDRGTRNLQKLRTQLAKHQQRVSNAASAQEPDEQENAWINVLQGVGSLEPLFGRTISDLAVTDVLLVAAAESYINAIAGQVLPSSDAEQFEKLSPVGKWLFLPKVMRLKWQPSLARGPLQRFAALVSRRNRVIHPRLIKVRGTSEVERFVEQLRLDAKSASDGASAVEDLIREISLSWRGAYGPDWLKTEKAAKRPPCFILGTVEAPMRLARLRPKQKDA